MRELFIFIVKKTNYSNLVTFYVIIMNYFLGVDVGTESVRVGLFDSAGSIIDSHIQMQKTASLIDFGQKKKCQMKHKFN